MNSINAESSDLLIRTVSSINEIDLKRISSKEGNSQDSDIFYLIPTLSPKKCAATKHLNQYVKEHPESLSTVSILISYSTQKWAKETREKYNMTDKYGYTKIIDDQYSDIIIELRDIWKITGISPKLECDDWLYNLQKADQILGLTEEAFEWLRNVPVTGSKLYEAVMAVHSFDTAHVVSRYWFDKYYIPAVEAIDRHYGPEFSSLVSDIYEIPWWNDEQYKYAYHNAEKLLKIYPIVKKIYTRDEDIAYAWSDTKIQKTSNGLALLDRIDNAVDKIKDFPDNGDLMYRILLLIMDGNNSKKIMQQLKLKYNTYYYMRKRSINCLSILLWGYSTERVISGIIKSAQKGISTSHLHHKSSQYNSVK